MASQPALADDEPPACVRTIRHVLSTIGYAGKDESVLRKRGDLIRGGPKRIDWN